MEEHNARVEAIEHVSTEVLLAEYKMVPARTIRTLAERIASLPELQQESNGALEDAAREVVRRYFKVRDEGRTVHGADFAAALMEVGNDMAYCLLHPVSGGEGRSVEELMPPAMTIAAIWGTDPQEKWCRASEVRAALSRALGASHQMPEEPSNEAVRAACASRKSHGGYDPEGMRNALRAAYRAEKGASQ